jgi:hypothetical protein
LGSSIVKTASSKSGRVHVPFVRVHPPLRVHLHRSPALLLLLFSGKIGFIEFSLISRTYFLESTVPSSTCSLFSELGAPTVPLTCTKGRSPSSGISVGMGISTMISRSEHEDSKGAMRSRRLRAPAAGGGKRANSFCLRQLECSASFVPYGWES